VPDLEGDLRATAEDIASDASELTSIEKEKAGLQADDPRLAELSRRGERLARRILPKTIAERELVDDLAIGAGGAAG
jgi:hypothetical protein